MAGNKQNAGFIAFICVIVLAVIAGVAGTVSVFRHDSPAVMDDDEIISELENDAEDAAAADDAPAQDASGSKKRRSSKKDDASRAFSFYFFKNGKPSVPAHRGNYIARLYITGTITGAGDSYNQKWLLDTIDELENDENNKGIILFINSPGGAVYESDEAYLRLLEYRKSKPVYAYMGSLAASGGYYISCASSYIMANRNTLTGSIGVIAGEFLDLTGLMQKYGVKSETIHAGKNKNMGNYNEPATDEQRQIMQSVADECYEQFTGIVAESRSMSRADVVALADGRIYTAQQAKRNGLIDDIGSWDDIVSRMSEREFGGKEYTVEDYSYERQDGFYRYLLGSVSRAVDRLSASAALPAPLERIIEPDIPFPAYYFSWQQ